MTGNRRKSGEEREIDNFSNILLDTNWTGSVTSASLYNVAGSIVSLSGGGYEGEITNWGGSRVLPLGGFCGTCSTPIGESIGIH